MSGQKISILTLTRLAVASVISGHFVDTTGAPAVSGTLALGVAAENAEAGDMFPVDVVGTTTIIANGAVMDGSPLEIGPNGTAQAWVGGDNNHCVGYALESAEDGQSFEIFLKAFTINS